MSFKILGIMAALISAFSWAIGSILFKKISETASPLGMTLSKGVIGFFLLGAVYYLEGVSAMPYNVFISLAVSGIIGIALGDTFFFLSLKDLGPKTQVVFFMLGQIITAVLGMIFLNDIPTGLEWAGIFVTISGVALVLWKKIFSDTDNTSTGIKGIIYGVLSMLCFSVSLLLAKDSLQHVSTIGATFIRVISGTVSVLLFGMFTNKVGDWITPFRNIKSFAYLFMSVFVVMFGGFWLSLFSIKYVTIGVASALSATEPLFVLPLAYILLKEKISIYEIVGALLSVFGVILIISESI